MISGKKWKSKAIIELRIKVVTARYNLYLTGNRMHYSAALRNKSGWHRAIADRCVRKSNEMLDKRDLLHKELRKVYE